jgi:RNA polymerase sigma factor (sigma-70 family)
MNEKEKEREKELRYFLTALLSDFVGISNSGSSRWIRPNWRINNRTMKILLPIVQEFLPSSDLSNGNLSDVNLYVKNLLATTPSLTDRVVFELYHTFINPSSSYQKSYDVWKNYVKNISILLAASYYNKLSSVGGDEELIIDPCETYTTNDFDEDTTVEELPNTKLRPGVARHNLPSANQDEEIFHELCDVNFFNVETLFSGFDPERRTEPNRDSELSIRIKRYTRRKLWNCIRSKRREKEPYFGLSNRGVVAKSTKGYIKKALKDNISIHRFNLDEILANVYKDYLKKTGYFQDDENPPIRANQLQENDWKIICQKCQDNIAELTDVDWEIIRKERDNENCNFSLNPQSISIEFIKDELYCIGKRVRKYKLPKPQPKTEPDLSSLFPVIERSLEQLNPEDRRIIELDFRDGLNQTKTAQIIGIDQPQVCRKLREILRKIIRQAPNYTGQTIDKDLIKSVKQALKQFYRKDCN